MTKNAFVFDTYAIIELIRGNKNYEPYLDSAILINEFILTELCYNLIKEHNVDKAYEYTDKYSQYVIRVSPDVIKEAMLFRFNNRKQNISMTDCIGHILAKKLNIKFLTGDKEFENMENVEFVKA